MCQLIGTVMENVYCLTYYVLFGLLLKNVVVMRAKPIKKSNIIKLLFNILSILKLLKSSNEQTPKAGRAKIKQKYFNY